VDRPADYPLKDEQPHQDTDVSETMTYAELRDRIQAKQPVTDEMIRAVVTQINQRHEYKQSEQSASISLTLNRLRNKLRPRVN